MKNLLLLLLTAITISLQAQTFQYGIQGGVNYNYSGDLTQLNILDNSADDLIHKAKSITGYHGGIWTKFNFSDLFLKPEILYTRFENEFTSITTYSLKTEKVDIPIVLGIKVLGPMYIFAGPDFQYILSENFSVNNTQVTYDQFTTGLNLGIGLDLNKISFELRWDKGLSESNSSIINSEFINSNFTLDNRANQLMLSLYYSFTDKE